MKTRRDRLYLFKSEIWNCKRENLRIISAIKKAVSENADQAILGGGLSFLNRAYFARFTKGFSSLCRDNPYDRISYFFIIVPKRHMVGRRNSSSVGEWVGGPENNIKKKYSLFRSGLWGCWQWLIILANWNRTVARKMYDIMLLVGRGWWCIKGLSMCVLFVKIFR